MHYLLGEISQEMQSPCAMAPADLLWPRRIQQAALLPSLWAGWQVSLVQAVWIVEHSSLPGLGFALQ